MPRQSPYRIVLSAAEKQALTARAAQYTRPYFEVLRAKMILLAAEGWSNDAIARSLQTRREVVSCWRKRFFEHRLAGAGGSHTLGAAPSFFPQRSSSPSKLSRVSCRRAPQRPLARWSMSELAAATQRTGLVASISGSTIWRWLHDDAIRPWFHRSWIFPRDPELCAQGRSDSGPLRARLGGATPGRGRLRDLRR